MFALLVLLLEHVSIRMMPVAIPNHPEIVDLTTSSPERIVISDDDQLIVTVVPTRTNGKKLANRRKRRIVEDGEIAEGSAQTSRDHSIERAPLRRTRSRDGPSRSAASRDFGVEMEVDEERRKPKRHGGDYRSREQSPRRRRRSYSPEPRKRDAPLPPQPPDPPLFFIDVEPADVKPADKPLARASADAVGDDSPKLLLPAHVSVFGGSEGAIPVEILPPSDSEAQDDDYIEYLDYEDRKGTDVLRYFDETDLEPKQVKIVCKNCGAEGKHKTYQCPVQICLTCGAKDEHSTRGCPISKVCHTCGMKGHLRQICPNRYSRDVGGFTDDCDRCGSDIHKTNECPTWWRLYEYLSDNEREKTLQARREKSALRIGYGGEGYIAEDQWCYNCGDCGHLGDDCEAPHLSDRSQEPSAFGLYNTMSGPFFDSSAEQMPSVSESTSRRLREWERDKLPDGWGHDAPVNVGKQGRKKDRAKMERMATDDNDDADDWFGSARNVPNRGPPKRPVTEGRGSVGKKISIGFSASHLQSSFVAPAWNGNQSGPAPSLLDRISSTPNPRYQPIQSQDSHSQRNRGAPKSNRSRQHESGDIRRRDKERERDRRERERPGPRYKGGYGR